MRELEEQMKTPDTKNHVWAKDHWMFRCIVGNGTDKHVWLQIWNEENIIWSRLIPARQDRIIWLEGDKHYMFQWKEAGKIGHTFWSYRGWELDSKAAFIANRLLIAWLLEEEPKDAR